MTFGGVIEMPHVALLATVLAFKYMVALMPTARRP